MRPTHKLSCRGAAVAALLAGALYGRSAWAVGGAAAIDLNRFHPAPGVGKLLTVDTADVGGHISLVPQLFFHYADRPLNYTLGGVYEADAVKHRLTADLSLSLSLWRRLQIALAFPVTLHQMGDQLMIPPYVDLPQPPPPSPVARAGQEDLRLLVKGRIWSNERFGVGAVGDLSLPTGNADSYLGSRLPTFTLRAVGHLTYGRLSAALNVGWLFGATEQVLNLQSGMGLTYSGGVQVRIGEWKGAVFYGLGEVLGLAHARFSTPRETPTELTLSGKAEFKRWTLYLGAGPGLSSGYGTSNVRVFAGANWRWDYVRKPPPPPPPYVPPPPPPVLPTCEGEDCPKEPKRPIKVEVKGPVLVLSERVFFDFDKDTIKPVSYPLLDEVVKVLRARPDLGKIRIEGHTDGIGSDAYNLDLSQRRAHSVVLYLTQHNIEADRLSSIGYGKRCPIVSNDTPDNRAINRRVDFVIVTADTVITTDPSQCPPVRKPQEEVK